MDLSFFHNNTKHQVNPLTTGDQYRDSGGYLRLNELMIQRSFYAMYTLYNVSSGRGMNHKRCLCA